MEKLALMLSLVCLLYIILFIVISYWQGLWSNRVRDGLRFRFLKLFIERKQPLEKKQRNNNRDQYNRAA